MKICTKCKINKPKSEFYKRSDRPVGVKPSCKKCESVMHREHKLKKKYGLSLNRYKSMSNKQKSVCYICDNKCKSYRNLAVDHCHKTGKVRKLLCTKCNTALGAVNDDVDILTKMIDYLEEHREI